MQTHFVRTIFGGLHPKSSFCHRTKLMEQYCFKSREGNFYNQTLMFLTAKVIYPAMPR